MAMRFSRGSDAAGSYKAGAGLMFQRRIPWGHRHVVALRRIVGPLLAVIALGTTVSVVSSAPPASAARIPLAPQGSCASTSRCTQRWFGQRALSWTP